MQLVRLLLTLVAFAVALASSQPAAASNASSLVLINSSHESHARKTNCELPVNAVWAWYYNTYSDGPHYCKGPELWSMIRSYRSAGSENVHWKFTDTANEDGCMIGWKFYAEDGVTLLAQILVSSTEKHSNRSWCALPVYRSGGVQGKQWEYCTCWKG